jgi:hypothetical protein
MVLSGARRLAAALVTGTALATLLTASGVGAAPAQGQPPRAQRPEAAHTVTLITGDRVRVLDLGGQWQAVDMQRPRGVAGGVRSETIGGDLYVPPPAR